MYKAHTCLWSISDEAYHNKQMRNNALNSMLPAFKEINPDATIATVAKKIKSIRSVFNKKVNKIKASMRSGCSVYKPKLWYFDHLKFLDDRHYPNMRSLCISSEEHLEIDEMPTTSFRRKETKRDQLTDKLLQHMNKIEQEKSREMKMAEISEKLSN
ncbi:uncharacterized protein LOC113367427 [Ctenocephalides felis]|uniref:uncharacterized protein LOC113367427 n=1 Tax=Ctenocephalides felis TaxID=7515 RepID=UPI000E6E2F84|nr:uncharacterized protein LOC113367427 [Ctenocephalides felis]